MCPFMGNLCGLNSSVINSGILHNNQTFLSGSVLFGLVFRGFCGYASVNRIEEVSVNTEYLLYYCFCFLWLFVELSIGLF